MGVENESVPQNFYSTPGTHKYFTFHFYSFIVKNSIGELSIDDSGYSADFHNHDIGFNGYEKR
jgi:hypothetical protein